MLTLNCDVCNGVLQRDADGSRAVCQFCGTAYPIERLRDKTENGKAGDGVGIGLTITVNGMEIKDGVLTKYTKNETHIVIPHGVTRIDDGVFFRCSHLQSIVFPESLTHIGNYVFMGCTNLKTVVLPKGLKQIGAGTFRHCSGLQSADIPFGVTELSHTLFSGCLSLNDVTIPRSVKRIERQAFSFCKSLKSVVIPTDVETIGTGAFGDSGIEEVRYNGRLDIDFAFINTPWYNKKWKR